MADFLDEKRKEIQARLKELKPLVEEYTRLEAAERALSGVGTNGTATTRSTGAAGAADPRAPAGAAARAAAARAPCRRSSWSRRAPASPSPSSQSPWGSSRTTCIASCPPSPKRERSRNQVVAGTLAVSEINH